MRDHHPIEVKLTRRGLVAGAAAGTFALASDPARAQRCPEVPPVRTKGPPVWLDLDQEALDDAYDQAVYAFNSRNIAERHAANNEKALAAIGKPERVAYGPTGIEKVDIYRTRRPNAPTMIFIHGGAKRGNYVKFTDEMEEALSAQRHIDKIHTPLVLAHGTLETPEFQRQTRDFAAALMAAGKPVQLIVGKGYNHYEIGETLGNPYAIMGRAALEMMKLTTA